MSEFDLENESKAETERKGRQSFLEYLDAKYLFYCDSADVNLKVYYWTEKRWSPNSEAVILEELADYFQKSKPPISKEGALDYYRGKGQKTKVIQKPPHIIAFDNGLLNIDTDEFIAPQSGLFVINVVPYKYDKSAKCPKWEQFIAEIHHPEDILFVQEWLGYNLYSAVTRKALYIAIGQTNTGKTVLLETVSKIIGVENTISTTLQQIAYDDYSIAQFYQKLANISDDITSQTIAYSGTLKTLADGGRVRAREIYGKPFDFDSYAKITDSCNEPPEIRDESDAIWERLKFVEYPNVFNFSPDPEKGERQARDKLELEASLLEEASGILNWMIEGLKRLKASGWRFSYNKSTDQVRDYYRRVSKPVVSWINEGLKFTGLETDLIAKEELYPAFDAWRTNHKIKNQVSKDKFFRQLNDEGLIFQQLREYNRRRFLVGYVSVTTSQPKDSSFTTIKRLDSLYVEQDRVSGCDPVTPEEDEEGGDKE